MSGLPSLEDERNSLAIIQNSFGICQKYMTFGCFFLYPVFSDTNMLLILI